MKKTYKTPKALMIEFEYEDRVAAASVATCSGTVKVYQTAVGCEEYKFTDYQKAKSVHPCDWVVTNQPFPN